MDWFLFKRDLHHERANPLLWKIILTIQCAMSLNVPTHFKNLAAVTTRFYKLCLNALRRFALDG